MHVSHTIYNTYTKETIEYRNLTPGDFITRRNDSSVPRLRLLAHGKYECIAHDAATDVKYIHTYTLVYNK